VTGGRHAAVAPVVALTLALAACFAALRPRDVPAVLTHPTAESRTELERVVSSALNGGPVTLADDALTADSTLIVDRAVRRDAQGRPLEGRRTDRPEQFRLVSSGSRCVLIQESRGRRFTLTAATCAPR
jgi:hypothetical protein